MDGHPFIIVWFSIYVTLTVHRRHQVRGGVRNEHAIEPIVSRELFDLCQKRRTKRKHKNYELRAKDEYYLSGKVFCA